MTNYELYQIDPNTLLDKLFEESSKRCYGIRPRIFIHCGLMGIDKKTRYGHFQYFERKDLEGRKYSLEFWDGDLYIFFIDKLFDPCGCKYIDIGEC